MSRNGSGTYTLPSGNPVVSGTLIEATWANSTLSDIASSLTDSLSRSGQGGMTAALRLFDGTSSVPGLAWGSETTTGFYRAGAGDTRLVVTGSQVMQFLSTGVAITGTLSASGNATVGGTLGVTGATTLSSTLAVNGATVTVSNSTAFFPQIINRNTTSDANASYLVLDKIRGSSVVQNGDVLGNLAFRGFDGAQYLQGAYINAVVSAAPGTNDMPADLVFGTTADGGAGPSERMRLNNAGNLGLGVTPSAWGAGSSVLQNPGGAFWNFGTGSLNVSCNNYFDGSNYRYRVNGNSSYYNQSSGIHSWYTAPSGTAGNAISFTQAMTLDASGRLMLGRTNLSANAGIFEVDGNGPGATVYTAKFSNSNTGSNIYNVVTWGQGQSGTAAGYIGTGGSAVGNASFQNNFVIGTQNSSPLVFNTGDAERARIDSSGNLLVRTTSTTTVQGSARFKVRGDAGESEFFAVDQFGTAICTKSSTGSQNQILFTNPNGTVGSITTSGSATSYVTSSDYRLKNTIAPMTGALAKVAALKPCTYKWNADGSDGEGFIAHELQAVVPQCVTGEKDAVDAEGKPVYQGIDTSFLVATLTAAIQEQQVLIQTLTARVTALEGTQP